VQGQFDLRSVEVDYTMVGGKVRYAKTAGSRDPTSR
jgi:hypothetical protein